MDRFDQAYGHKYVPVTATALTIQANAEYADMRQGGPMLHTGIN